MKLLTLNSNKSPSSYYQPSYDLIKLTLPKSPEKYSHASQFTKHLSFMTLEGNNLLQIKKLCYAIISAFFQPLSTNKTWISYKSLREEHHNISYFLLPLDPHPEFFHIKIKL